MHVRDATAAPPRPAASLILVRRPPSGRPRGARLLMGLRPADARFMPSVWVFPGGALDPALDSRPRPGETPLGPIARAELSIATRGAAPEALARCALRETAEETGLALRPDLAALRYAYRAITPRAQRIRFDARFFCADAETAAAGPLDAVAPADGELDAVAWVDRDAAAELAIAPITQALLDAAWTDLDAGRAVGPKAAPARLIETELALALDRSAATGQ